MKYLIFLVLLITTSCSKGPDITTSYLQKNKAMSCFFDGNHYNDHRYCKIHYLKKGESPLNEIHVCFMQIYSDTDKSIAIDCDLYDKVENAY